MSEPEKVSPLGAPCPFHPRHTILDHLIQIDDRHEKAQLAVALLCYRGYITGLQYDRIMRRASVEAGAERRELSRELKIKNEDLLGLAKGKA